MLQLVCNIVRQARNGSAGRVDDDGLGPPFQTGEYVLKQPRPERRRAVKPIPDDLMSLLNAEQAKALPELEEKGVVLYAVRRPLFQEPVFIVKLESKGWYGVLLENGKVDYFSDVPMREQQRAGIEFRIADVAQVID